MVTRHTTCINTVLLSILHLLTDFLCALAMFGIWLPRGNVLTNFLIYNFCAFALQLPLGSLLDVLDHKSSNAFVVLGILLSVAGGFLSPAVLGLGNALFHVGGGVQVILDDDRASWNGRGLGVFVAPGAIGLALGSILGKGGYRIPFVAGAACALVILGLYVHGTAETAKAVSVNSDSKKLSAAERTSAAESKSAAAVIIALCTIVVVIRSYTGTAVSFPWKSGTALILFSTLMVACGKTAGGFLAAQFGHAVTAGASLMLAAILYMFSASMIPGLLALFLFNMSMPLTLYLVKQVMPGYPGTAFGILTLALFIGYVLSLVASGSTIISGAMSFTGAAGSIISAVLLVIAFILRSRS